MSVSYPPSPAATMSMTPSTLGYNASNILVGVTAAGSQHQEKAQMVLLICILAGACSLLTIVGNVVVIVSFFINKSLRNFSNYLILSLAISDLTIGAFSMNVYTTYNVKNEWILGEVMCKAWLAVDYTASNASVMNLLVICVDRYLAITKPVKYRKWCTPQRAAIAIAAVWILSFLMWCPAIVLWDLFSTDTKMPTNDCYIPFMKNNAWVTVATIVGAFYIPATAMCALYYQVISKLRKRRLGLRSLAIKDTLTMAVPLPVTTNNISRSDEKKSISSNSASVVDGQDKCDQHNKQVATRNSRDNPPAAATLANTTTSLLMATTVENDLKHSDTTETNSSPPHEVTMPLVTRRSASIAKANSFSSIIRKNSGSKCFYREPQRVVRERRVTVLLKFILTCFIVLWLPYSLIILVTSFWPSCEVPIYIWNLSYWLCYLNSTVNPFCYGFCNENFRQTFKVIITTKWWKKEVRKSLRLSRRTSSGPYRCSTMLHKKREDLPRAKMRERFKST
ncbi:muscarinic acetylcholine receptor M2-like [Ciona intestinalis]